AIARSAIILKAEGFKVDLVPIRYHPDDAGLIGCLHLAPSWIFEAHDSILAVDIGGTNIICGVVETRFKKAPDLSKASVWESTLWCHAADEPTRQAAIQRVGDHDTAVLMHNDGVVQSLSEVPFMQDVERWGVLTIGTRLGNARFTNRRKNNSKDNDKEDKKEKKSKE